MAQSAVALVLLLAAPTLAESFVVNSYTTGPQAEPVAVCLPDGGNLVAIWESADQDGDDSGVFGRLVDPAGAVGAEFPVNQATDDSQGAPAAAVAGEGFVVVWEDYDLLSIDDRLKARVFDADGNPLADEFRVDTSISEYHVAPSVSASKDGRFVVVWDDYSDVFAQMVDLAGAKVGGEFRINQTTGGYQALASVAMLAAGGFVVAWTDGSYYGGRDGDGYGVFARRFDGDGMPAGEDFQVNVASSGDQFAPDVVGRPDGGFTVIWESYDLDTGYGRVAGRRFDAIAQPLGGEFDVSGAEASYPGSAAAAVDADGTVLTVWSDLQPSLELGVVGRRFDAAGSPLESPLALDPAAAVDQIFPDACALDDGRFFAVWQADGGDGDGPGVVGLVALVAIGGLWVSSLEDSTYAAPALAEEAAPSRQSPVRLYHHAPSASNDASSARASTST